MKKTNRILSGVLSFCILFTFLLQVFSPIVSFAAEETIYIESASDLIDFAKKCSYDAWSVGKTVILSKDVSLEGVDFSPIPSFSGVFDGANHMISGMDLQDSLAPAGLFTSLEKDGMIKNLTVTGTASPEGDKRIVGGIVGDNYGKIENCIFIGTVMGKSDVGGIAGINRLSGSISGCQVGGEIIGEEHTGGIAGNNAGLISSCNSTAKVNTVSITPALSLDEINISLTLDISKLPSLNNTAMTDTGGICGYSTGMIIGCTNNGRVGYPHVGYNVGGIVGRSSGHLSANTNNAEVYGRKDVGGIVGQMEPYVSYQLSEDLLASLRTELDEIGLLVNEAIESADGSIPAVSDRLGSILFNLMDATDALDTLMGDVTDFGGDFIGEINRISEILSEVLSQLSDICTDAPELTEIFGNGLDSLEKALLGLEDVASLGANSIADLIMVAQDASLAFDKISVSIDNVNEGVASLENSIKINDKDAAKAALDTILAGLGEITTASDEMTEAIGDIVDVLGDASWAEDAIDQFGKMTEEFEKISSAVSDIYDATAEVNENVDLHWEKIKEGGDGLISAFGSFTEAMNGMVTSLDLMDLGLGKITEGLEGLYNSVSINDSEAAVAAAKQIAEGFDELVEAVAKGSSALSKLSGALEGLDGEDPSAIITKISEALGILSESGDNATDAITKLSEGMAIILDNVKIDVDLIGESGSLIIGGIGDMTDALKTMRSAVKSMSEGMTSLNEAINAISSAVEVKDEKALGEALDKAYIALGVIVGAVEELSGVISDSAKTIDEARLWSISLVDATKGVTDALSSLTKAISKVQSGVDSLRENLSFDEKLYDEGMSLIREGFADVSDAAEHIKDALTHLADSFSDLEGAMDKVSSVALDFAEAVSAFADGAEIITDMTEGANKLLGYLKGVDTIQLPTPPESIKTTANKLFLSISEIENELNYLNTDITGLSMDLLVRIGKINDIFNEMTDNIVDMIYGLPGGSIINNDVSEEEIDSVTNGKLFSCANYGNVYGDINVGGISGAMGLEYSLDPEDDLSAELTVTQKKQYQLKAVIHASRNYGQIVSKRDGVGGICGKMDFGLIYGCESYCDVQSEAGNYVGGIAGITAGLISQCFVKSTLSGGKYVGGIVGSGVSEDYSGDSSMVRNNYAMVEILRYSQYAGAISGANIGQYGENLFVSDTLAGIDRVSYQGKAEPISYEDLIKRRSIPTGFYSFVLKFVADGVVLSTVEFEYGKSFDKTIFPEIPEKDGHYGYWDRTDLTELVFDTTVNVIYKPYVTALGSEEKRDTGREIFIVQGNFTEDCKITVSKGANLAGLTLLDRFFTKDSLAEVWVIEIPSDNLDSNSIHFLPENENCKIFAKLDGEWQEIEAKEFGSYLTFDANGEKIELAIVEHSVKLLPIIIIAFLLLVSIAAGIIIILVKRKKKTVKSVKTEEPKE